MMGKVFLLLTGALLLVSCSPATLEISPTPEPETLVFSTATLPPTQTPWLTSTPRPTYTPNPTKTKLAEATPTLDLMSLTEPWKTYTNREIGISFDYPSVFDETDRCSIQTFEMEGFNEVNFMGFLEWTEIWVGRGRFPIYVVSVGDTSLLDAVDGIIDRNIPDRYMLSKLDISVNDYDTVQVEYTFDFAHYKRMTFFKNNDKLFVAMLGSATSCETHIDKNLNRKSHLREYFRIVESIRFLD